MFSKRRGGGGGGGGGGVESWTQSRWIRHNSQSPYSYMHS